MTKCCGDAHLLNFGMFAAPDRWREGAGHAAARHCASSYRTEMARAVQRRRKEITKAERRTSLKVMTKFCDQGRRGVPDPAGPPGDRPLPDRAQPRDVQRVAQRDMKGSMVVPAEQNEKDYQALVDAVATGRVRAVMGLLTANPRPRLTGPLLLRPGLRSGPRAAVVAQRSGNDTAAPLQMRQVLSERADDRGIAGLSTEPERVPEAERGLQRAGVGV